MFLQGSDGTNAFDVILLADHTVLKPAGADFTGTVLPGPGPPQIIVECVGGVKVTGSNCSSVDTADTIELALAACLGCPPTASPTTGLLFTAIYNVTGPSFGITIGYQTGCTTTSVAGTTTCVTLANGPTLDPETVETATFGSSVSPGVVCLVQSGITSCPFFPGKTNGAVGTQLRISVFIQGSAPLNGFDITVLANHTIVQPVGIDLTGSVLITPGGPPIIVAECIAGKLVVGSSCSSVQTVDTIELAARDCLGCGVTANPTTGLLFTAIYNIISVTTGTTITFQSGCNSTSVAGTTQCILVTNGTATPVPEMYNYTVLSTADFTITANPASLTILRGSSGGSTVTLASVSGFAGNVNLAASIAPATTRSPAVSLSSSAVILMSNGSGSSTLTISTSRHTAFGIYSVTITGTSGTLTHSVTVTVTVTH